MNPHRLIFHVVWRFALTVIPSLFSIALLRHCPPLLPPLPLFVVDVFAVCNKCVLFSLLAWLFFFLFFIYLFILPERVALASVHLII